MITGPALVEPGPTTDRGPETDGQRVDAAGDKSNGQSVPAPPDNVPDNADVVSTARPPWQRTTSEVRYAPPPDREPKGDEPTAKIQGWVHTPAAAERPGQAADSPAADKPPVASPTATAGFDADSGSRTTINLGMAAAAARGLTPGVTPTALRRPGRGPRRASLQVKRVDPWSVLKLSFALSIALFFVWLVAVGVLYGVLDGMGVWDKLNGTYNEFAQNTSAGGSGPLITAGRVFGIAAVIGAINIVLFTALATVGAFVYNISSDIAGGLEMTLAERE